MSNLEQETHVGNNHAFISSTDNPNYKILLYVPNAIGYARLILLASAFYFFSSSGLFVFLYSLSAVLDSIDGYTARKFDQCSLFGAWLDVVIDNISRGLLWVHIHPSLYLVAVVEWVSFVCNHQLGADWRWSLAHKVDLKLPEPPSIVLGIMENNFRNFWGVWAIAGLHVLPVWIVATQKSVFDLLPLPTWLPFTGLIVFSTGRGICFIAEIWSIYLHILSMLSRSV